MAKKEFQTGIDSVFTNTLLEPITGIPKLVLEDDTENISKNMATKEPMTTANFRIPVSLHKELKKRAIEEDTTIMAIIAKAIREYMDKPIS